MAQASSAFRLVALCENRGDEVDWSGPLGRISLELLQQAVPDFQQREVFVCGPAGYMKAVQEMLLRGGHDPARYHQESFDFATVAAENAAAPAAENAAAQGLAAEGQAALPSYTVHLLRSARTFTMDCSQTVLLAAKKAGAVVPSSCNSGMCGTCKTMLLEGAVEMQHNGGIRQREIDKGMRLLCCSRPTSNLVLDL